MNAMYKAEFSTMIPELKYDKYPVSIIRPLYYAMEQDILQKTSIHKLSYKYDKTKNIEGTFLEKILNNDI